MSLPTGLYRIENFSGQRIAVADFPVDPKPEGAPSLTSVERRPNRSDIVRTVNHSGSGKNYFAAIHVYEHLRPNEEKSRYTFTFYKTFEMGLELLDRPNITESQGDKLGLALRIGNNYLQAKDKGDLAAWTYDKCVGRHTWWVDDVMYQGTKVYKLGVPDTKLFAWANYAEPCDKAGNDGNCLGSVQLLPMDDKVSEERFYWKFETVIGPVKEAIDGASP